jgi:hypothetical protein
LSSVDAPERADGRDGCGVAGEPQSLDARDAPHDARRETRVARLGR